MKVEIYTKPDCGLCDEAKKILVEARRQVAFDLVEVNIESEATLLAEYRYDIPVVFVDGHKAFKHRLTLADVLNRLRRVTSRT